MKKTKVIKLIIIGTALSACNSSNESRLHMRSDTTGAYTHRGGYHGYYRFYPYGTYSPSGGYTHQGMDSRGIKAKSSSYEGKVARGGFGRSSYVVGG